jgi:hypothetical protein
MLENKKRRHKLEEKKKEAQLLQKMEIDKYQEFEKNK